MLKAWLPGTRPGRTLRVVELDFAVLQAASPRAVPWRSNQCPFCFLQFPDFDPVLIAIGPFQIRWYALAYIVGILLGWFYARALIRNERLWGGPAPLTLADFDDFVLWVTLGIILGGRTGYVLFYNPAHFIEHPMEAVQLWKGACRSTAALSAASWRSCCSP